MANSTISNKPFGPQWIGVVELDTVATHVLCAAGVMVELLAVRGILVTSGGANPVCEWQLVNSAGDIIFTENAGVNFSSPGMDFEDPKGQGLPSDGLSIILIDQANAGDIGRITVRYKNALSGDNPTQV